MNIQHITTRLSRRATTNGRIRKLEQDEEDECILDVIDVNIVKMRPRRRPSGTRTRQ